MNTLNDITDNLLKDKDWENPKSLEELGYIFFGPLVCNYFFWLKNEITDGDLILFNSREGYFLNQIYQEFKVKYNLPNSVYFKTSRKLASLASFVSEEDVYKSFRLHRYNGTLSDLLKNRFELDIPIINDEFIDTHDKLPELSLYIVDILAKSKSTRTNYKKYIDNIIGECNNVYMIDSGFQGTTQYYLEKTFNLNLQGRYMTYKGNLDLKNTKGFYNFDKCNFKDNIIFFESVFTDIVGTYIDVVDDKFINEKNSQNQKYFTDKIKIVDGIKKFVSAVLSFDIDESIISEGIPDTIFNSMCTKDYIKNELLFNSFFHDNQYVRNNIKKITRK